MNVAADEFKLYVETFHRTLEETAKQHLPADLQQSLFHLSWQPCGLHAYVSTQFGVAWEYVTNASGTEVTLGKSTRNCIVGGPSDFPPTRDTADQTAHGRPIRVSSARLSARCELLWKKAPLHGIEVFLESE